MAKFTAEEMEILKRDLPEFWVAEDGYLVHPTGDKLVKGDSPAYPFTLHRTDSFKSLSAALGFLEMET